MKKISLILLITIYSLYTLGIGVKQFYCCGKLTSTDINIVQKDTKDKCGKGSMKGCRKVKFQSLKVQDSHVAGDGITTPVKHFTDFHLFTPYFQVSMLAIKPLEIANPTHAPPLHHGVAIYILQCVYRI